ncbi:hypothetical protein KAM481_37290 [Aeromonas caviae]|uniref:hypothetical protein n=1 Tax=Aeromonas caviae TaxID=648 RepID=UPI001FBA76AE|nr:hypothetical protein [Aeromonas caviae]BDO10906.1 hypothetical protein KAM643c_44790 [Aeromonas caviae]GKR80259.1 hypothetical protein KAM481_37290 [Aeromonas caviae]
MERSDVIGELAKRYRIVIGEDDPIFMVVDVAMMAADERLAETQALFDEAGKQLLAGLSDEIIRLHNIAEGVRLNAQEAGAGIIGALDDRRNEMMRVAERLEQASSSLSELQEKMLTDTAANVAEHVTAYTNAKKESEWLDLKKSINSIVDDAVRQRVEQAFGSNLSQSAMQIEKLGNDAAGFSQTIKENYSDVSGFLSRFATVALCVVCSIASVVGLRIIGFL